MKRFFVLPLLILLVAACSAASGLPPVPGRYTLKEKSITFDGERYGFLWADASGALKRANTDDVKLQLDEENFLEVKDDKEAVLHLKQDEPVTVEARDEQGDYGNFWFPFLVGSMLSRGGPVVVNQPVPADYRQPQHRFPPTDSFDRGDTIQGNATSNTKRAPDYSRTAPVGGAVSGQQGGAGGANAATNRAAVPAAQSGQQGGTGSGSAALNKSGSFKAGSQGYNAKVDSGAAKSVTGGSSAPRVGAGSGAAKSSAPKITAPRASVPRISIGRRR